MPPKKAKKASRSAYGALRGVGHLLVAVIAIISAFVAREGGARLFLWRVARIPAIPDAENAIFVGIAAYCDRELNHTLTDLFRKAKHPERVFVGLVNQERKAPFKLQEVKQSDKVKKALKNYDYSGFRNKTVLQRGDDSGSLERLHCSDSLNVKGSELSPVSVSAVGDGKESSTYQHHSPKLLQEVKLHKHDSSEGQLLHTQKTAEFDFAPLSPDTRIMLGYKDLSKNRANQTLSKNDHSVQFFTQNSYDQDVSTVELIQKGEETKALNSKQPSEGG